ncbi:MAG: hypothetical protein H6738_10685 [Alphaproteobacteria bacterium]|nr:hypothetical protein [Alphaproteobacteria bacterium]MCB9697236.1 hypothetical protein [Alphaproteobacteria bacterium]
MALWLWACGSSGVAVSERVVPAACGLCVFHMEGAKSCFWAVEIDGEHYAVSGVAPPFDMAEAHEDDGQCKVERSARVEGTLTADHRFVATRFELLPYDGSGRKGTKEHD